MPVTRYGIYLAYGPTVDMRFEGLGRHLSALLLAASKRDDLRFVIACPSWTRASLLALCKAEGLPENSFDVLSPAQKPALLRLYDRWRARSRRPRRGWLERWLERSAQLVARALGPLRRYLVATRNPLPVIVAGLLLVPLAAVALVVAFFAALVVGVGLAVRLLRRRFRPKLAKARTAAMANRMPWAGRSAEIARKLLTGRIKDVSAIVGLYREMEAAEIARLHRLIERAEGVHAWYCPTAFWPSVAKLERPHLICVPDVVLSDFAASFGTIGGERLLHSFQQIERVLAGNRHFVTYSSYVKRETLVRRFGVEPAAIDVVPHGAIRLDGLVTIEGTPDTASATRAFCSELLSRAVDRARLPGQVGLLGEQTRYIFYPSQFRPHKNIVNLLRACEHLLRRRYVSCKLVLTGHGRELGIHEYVEKLRMQNEVVYLERLSPQELAAGYRMAALAVNPSLFEGGLPFTFSEAVSVGTPAVMARIPVTVEAISDPALCDEMLFDPHDWKDIAARIEWALEHRESLYARQRAYFDAAVAPRSWGNVLDEYVAILQRIGGAGTREARA